MTQKKVYQFQNVMTFERIILKSSTIDWRCVPIKNNRIVLNYRILLTRVHKL